ncbi:response regulator [Pontimicrobium aquaticum]|uniref:Response regulator n=1 Tax=Pontimicrobium aquaticum TaxID=2565367 RepID=A0A4U0EZC4_9FLAO|nr:response regulator [Pontimicrobium aquaticum]TJY37406.1 response regulator [Pontimicrobium aquaticum]
MNSMNNVLIIDDHPLIVNAYKDGLLHLSKLEEALKFNIESACDCDEAISLILKSQATNGYDLIFLDIQLPPSKDKKILSGEDLGVKIRKLTPNTRIIVSTTYTNNYRLYNIFKTVDPDGFLVKTDLTNDMLMDAIKTVIKYPPYYCKTISKLIRKEMSSKLILDKVDRDILYQLSIGTRTKDLPKFIPLSKPGIEGRKRHLRKIFNVENKNDGELIKAARNSGFL